MNKMKRNILQVIGVPLALICGLLAISSFICGVLEGDGGAWSVFFFCFIGCIIGIFCVLLTYSIRLENALRKSFFADAIILGGKQMLYDIIKWTIIIIIAAIVFSVTYKIIV